MTLHPTCESVETSEGVPLFVTGVSQVKIMNKNDDEEDISCTDKAAEQFLGKTSREIADLVLQTLEGHLRAILGRFSCKEEPYSVGSHVKKVMLKSQGYIGIA